MSVGFVKTTLRQYANEVGNRGLYAISHDSTSRHRDGKGETYFSLALDGVSERAL